MNNDYTGRRLPTDTKCIKHTKVGDFYLLYHPLEKNVLTGNATFPKWTLKSSYNKNYIFQYYDENYNLKTIMIGREHVSKCCFPLFKKKKIKIDPITNIEYEIPGGFCCYGIKISDIFKYGKPFIF